MTIANATVDELVNDLGFNWYWTQYRTRTPKGYAITYWEDGIRRPDDNTAGPRRHTVEVTYKQLRGALRALADGEISTDPYQIRAGRDYLRRPSDADGDAETTDLVLQHAAFGRLTFG